MILLSQCTQAYRELGYDHNQGHFSVSTDLQDSKTKHYNATINSGLNQNSKCQMPSRSLGENYNNYKMDS